MKISVFGSVAALAVLGVSLSACSSGEQSASAASSASTPTTATACNVVTAFYPIAYATEQVGGDAVAVTTLTQPGVEPHDLELTPSQVAAIQQADLVFYLPGFQPAVDTAVAQQAGNRAVNISAGITPLPAAGHSEDDGHGHDEEGHSSNDPHIWLNPANMATIGNTIATALESCDPADATAIAARAQSFGTKMTTLAADFTAGLANCQIKDMVVSHEAFGYLAQVVGLNQMGISGLSPEAEPTPARLSEVTKVVRANGITTIYYETLVDPKVARTIANETGAQTAVLDPLEGLAPGSSGDYESIMRENLATLKTGQVCS